ncbi:MAG: hypothetical protein WD206_03890 [Actinomycetota bacterium]
MAERADAERSDVRGLRPIAVALGVLLALAACTDRGADDRAARAGFHSPSAGTPAPSPVPSGPFGTARWSGEPVPTGALLHDDGRTLWSIALDGDRSAVWRHPEAFVHRVAASEDGRRVALAVTRGDDRSLGPEDPSAFLYVLEPDGSVRTVDVVDDYRVIEAPTFLRPPTTPRGPERVYWIRFADGIDDRGRLETDVMVDDGGPRRVALPLRFAEGVIDVYGYPGASRFSVTLFRQNDVPTRFEILRNDDEGRSTDAALTLWGNNEPRAQTDSGVGVAWISPTDYVIPVVHEFFARGYTLRRFRVGCEAMGSEVVYRGTGIDRGYEEVPWQLLPAGARRVLVLRSADVRRIADGRAAFARWHTIDLRSGRLIETSITWRPGEGGWTWVAPASRANDEGRCEGIDWRFP